jgi:anthranilate phosphoribosyltransferase
MSLTFKHILETLSEGIDLSPEEAEFALSQVVRGEVSSEEVAALLFGMRAKGETVYELTSFVRVMRNAAVSVKVNTDGAVDLCGTGGDSSGTFNISTAAMFVVAGANVPVLKHGNRSVSSKCGSADVLEELGIVATLDQKGVEQVFNDTSIAFMFAPNFHPAMKYVMPARRALGLRTFFNILGPLLNPADVKRQVIGAYNREVAETMIQILSNLDTEKAYTFNAHDGLDEVSITSTTEIYELQSSLINEPVLFDPESLGFERAPMEELIGGDSIINAEIIRNIVTDKASKPQKDIVLINSAFGIHASGKAGSLQEAVEMAVESIESGSADRKLRQFAEATREQSLKN